MIRGPSAGWCFTFTPRTLQGCILLPQTFLGRVSPERKARCAADREGGPLLSFPRVARAASGCPSNPKAARRGTQKAKNFLSCSRSSEGRNRWLKSKRNPDTASASPAEKKNVRSFCRPSPGSARDHVSSPRGRPRGFFDQEVTLLVQLPVLSCSACQRENRRSNDASSGHGDHDTAVHLRMTTKKQR